jgi:hypothetical protein
MCNLGNFLQLNMCQELPLFAFVYMCSCAGYVSLDFVTVTLELFPWLKLLSGPLVLHPAST